MNMVDETTAIQLHVVLHASSDVFRFSSFTSPNGCFDAVQNQSQSELEGSVEILLLRNIGILNRLVAAPSDALGPDSLGRFQVGIGPTALIGRLNERDLFVEGERMPVYVHVIDHPDARILVDTGMAIFESLIDRWPLTQLGDRG
jgi:hypothetical protein